MDETCWQTLISSICCAVLQWCILERACRHSALRTNSFSLFFILFNQSWLDWLFRLGQHVMRHQEINLWRNLNDRLLCIPWSCLPWVLYFVCICVWEYSLCLYKYDLLPITCHAVVRPPVENGKSSSLMSPVSGISFHVVQTCLLSILRGSAQCEWVHCYRGWMGEFDFQTCVSLCASHVIFLVRFLGPIYIVLRSRAMLFHELIFIGHHCLGPNSWWLQLRCTVINEHEFGWWPISWWNYFHQYLSYYAIGLTARFIYSFISYFSPSPWLCSIINGGYEYLWFYILVLFTFFKCFYAQDVLPYLWDLKFRGRLLSSS